MSVYPHTQEYLDNVVEFILAGPPSLQNLLGSVPRANPSQPDDYKGPEADQLEDQPTLRLTLRHTYEVKGASTVEVRDTHTHTHTRTRGTHTYTR